MSLYFCQWPVRLYWVRDHSDIENNILKQNILKFFLEWEKSHGCMSSNIIRWTVNIIQLPNTPPQKYFFSLCPLKMYEHTCFVCLFVSILYYPVNNFQYMSTRVSQK